MSAPVYLECEQGSRKWLSARCGKPTASRFGDIITTKGKASTAAARKRLMFELLGERITGRTAEHFATADMERGTRLEPVARAWYEMQAGAEVREVGFAYALDGRAGASPDGLVEPDGCIEIKCLKLHNHLAALMSDDISAGHYMQVQGVMWACQRDWCDFVHYTDVQGVPSRVLRVERNDVLIGAMAGALGAFCDELDALEGQARAKYGIAPAEDVDLEKVSGDWVPWVD